MNDLCRLVSRHRYEDEQFDLDLSYITPRVIAVGLPGEGLCSLGRNSIDNVAKFFKKRFGSKFLIINLAPSVNGNSKFGGQEQVKEFPFPDLSCPPLDTLMQIVDSMRRFLEQDPENVVAVHCLAGRGPTETAIAAYLLHCKPFRARGASEPPADFARQHLEQNEGVVCPSQIRYVHYYDRVLKGFPYRPGRRMLLKQLSITPVPAIEFGDRVPKGCCRPVLKVYSRGQLAYSSKKTTAESYRAGDEANLDINLDVSIVVSDDVKVRVYHQARTRSRFAEVVGGCNSLGGAKEPTTSLATFPNVPLFQFTFHTAFVEDSGGLTLRKRALDASFTGVANDSIFPKNMVVGLLLIDHTLLSMAGIDRNSYKASSRR